jgi:hypothetical protein
MLAPSKDEEMQMKYNLSHLVLSNKTSEVAKYQNKNSTKDEYKEFKTVRFVSDFY